MLVGTIGSDEGQTLAKDKCGNQVQVTVKQGERRTWTQTLNLAIVDESGKPVPDASASCEIAYSTRSRRLDLPATDLSGKSSVTWHPGRPKGEVTVTVTAVVGECSSTGSAVFLGANT
jgi:hypothetical protein